MLKADNTPNLADVLKDLRKKLKDTFDPLPALELLGPDRSWQDLDTLKMDQSGSGSGQEEELEGLSLKEQGERVLTFLKECSFY